jgi:hypothetical protein
VLKIVVLLLGPCNYLNIGTFNFDRIGFPFSLTVLAQYVLFSTVVLPITLVTDTCLALPCFVFG